MAVVHYVEQEVIIALNRRVIFVNPDDLQIFKEIEVPPDLAKYECIKSQVTKKDNTGEKTIKAVNGEPSISHFEEPCIQQVAISPDRTLFAIATVDPKALLLYQCRPEHAKLLSVRALARAPSALTFSNDSSMLLVTDKAGDCYRYDCLQVYSEALLLLGHMSVVFDVVWTPDMKHIITCDRDDKIRVSKYPDTYNIHGYCLGHQEFVAGIALLAENKLVSVSGDKTLRLWDYMSGRELQRFQLPAPGVKLSVRGPFDTGEYEAAVLLHQVDESVGIYQLSPSPMGDEESWRITQMRLISCPTMIATSLCFTPDRLLIIGITNGRFTLSATPIEKVPPNWITMIEEQFIDTHFQPSDIAPWFKKRYDNITEYLSRKKRRIERKELKQSN